MELRQLRHFIAAVDAGNLSSATDTTFLSQPALSRSIKNLENEVGAKLLERTARGVAPTEAGRQFYSEAKFILRECSRAIEDAGALARGVGSQVVISVSPMFMSDIAAHAVARVKEMEPSIDLIVVEADQRNNIAVLTEGGIDATLTIFNHHSLPAQIVSEHLCTVTAIVVAGSKNPISRKRKLAPTDFIDSRWVKIRSVHQDADVIEQFMMSNNFPPPSRAVKTNSIPLIKRLILEYGFLSMLPNHMLTQELTRHEVKALPMPAGGFRRPAGILYRAGEAHRVGLKIVLDAFREACDEFSKRHEFQ